jgi:hypothetical protein
MICLSPEASEAPSTPPRKGPRLLRGPPRIDPETELGKLVTDVQLVPEKR